MCIKPQRHTGLREWLPGQWKMLSEAGLLYPCKPAGVLCMVLRVSAVEHGYSFLLQSNCWSLVSNPYNFQANPEHHVHVAWDLTPAKGQFQCIPCEPWLWFAQISSSREKRVKAQICYSVLALLPFSFACEAEKGQFVTSLSHDSCFLYGKRSREFLEVISRIHP